MNACIDKSIDVYVYWYKAKRKREEMKEFYLKRDERKEENNSLKVFYNLRNIYSHT